MTATTITNLLVPTTAGQASPLNLLAGTGVTDETNSIFSSLVGSEEALAIDESLTDSLNPESGIVPVPVVSGTAHPILNSALGTDNANLSYISQRDGRVPSDILSGLKLNGEAPQGPVDGANQDSELGQGQLLKGSQDESKLGGAAGKFALDDLSPEARARFDILSAEKNAALNASQNSTQNNALASSVAANNQIAAESAAASLAASELEAEQVKQVEIAAQEAEELKNTTSRINATAEGEGAGNKQLDGSQQPILAQLNEQVKEEASKFKLADIDIDEVAIENTRFKELSASKLEAQVRNLDQTQHNQTPAEQVKVSISKAITAGVREVQINLNPSELGKVNVELELSEEGETKVRVVADRSETLDLLKRDQGDLQRALKDLGLETNSEGLEFSLNESGSDNQEFSGNEQQTGKDQEDEFLDLKPINEFQKYGNLNTNELILNIRQEGLNIVA